VTVGLSGSGIAADRDAAFPARSGHAPLSIREECAATLEHLVCFDDRVDRTMRTTNGPNGPNVPNDPNDPNDPAASRLSRNSFRGERIIALSQFFR
jgi:hypothetical protein